MNSAATSKDEILAKSRELVRQSGWSAVSIRSVAAACGVSVGCIYNYVDSKADLVGATVESAWREIFHRQDEPAAFRSTEACVTWMYERLAYGHERYPGFFTLHSLGFMGEEKEGGRRRMDGAWRHILVMLRAVLERDARVRPGAFTEAFTAERFADALFSLMLAAMLRGDFDPAAALEIVRRTLY